MILYGNALSPFVRKVIAFAAEKGVKLDQQPSSADDFKTASPFGKIPAFRDGDFAISDSTAIITYLDVLNPEPNLIPMEAKSRARTIWFEEYADTILMPTSAPIVFNRFVSPRLIGRPGDEQAAVEAETANLPPVIDYLESVIPTSGFLVEDRFTLADIAVTSPLITLMVTGWRGDAERHPKTLAYLQGIMSRPAYQRILAAEKALVG